MDRTPLREGGVRVQSERLWIAALAPDSGEESVYQADLPACCQRSARSAEDGFECHSCGAMWQAPIPVLPEEDALMRRGSEDERRGAA